MESNNQETVRPRRKEIIVVTAILLGVLVTAVTIDRARKPETQEAAREYPWHHNITATVFWVGEQPDASNDHITNVSSTWIRDWLGAFGGVDDPANRCGYAPCGFTPKENTFYAALPYNDLNGDCQPKSSQSAVYWYNGTTAHGETLIKNRRIEVRNGDKVAYPQLQDAGPFGEDDVDYVFGDQLPREPRAGLDLSPATADYLGINGKGQVSWRFIDEDQVPQGEWSKTVTTSGPDC